jgi:ubiquinone/menaquinone biosynthesis C-methylase UbiE
VTVTRWLKDHFPHLRQAISCLWYDYFSALDKGARVLGLNYGYAWLDGQPPLELEPEEEQDRYQLQMYHYLAGAVPWEGKDALEVGSGRGGGAGYIVRRFRPRSFVGLDLCQNAVDFCSKHYHRPGLSFRQGNAEALPFDDGSFDIVLNVESSLYYPHVLLFLAEVCRVLRGGGYFVYADMRYLEEVPKWREQLKASGLSIQAEQDITPNVVRALTLDIERKRGLIDRHVPGIFKPFFKTFTGLNGLSLSRGKPRIGERVYLSLLLQK